VAVIITDGQDRAVATLCLICDAEIPIDEALVAEMNESAPHGWALLCAECWSEWRTKQAAEDFAPLSDQSSTKS
jgi:hypothetical protein